MTPQEWITEIDAPDLPLALARQAYHQAPHGEQREAYLLAIVRAERRLAVQYAPAYVARVLESGQGLHGPGMSEAETARVAAAVARGE